MMRHTLPRVAVAVLAVAAMTVVSGCTSGGPGAAASSTPGRLTDAITAITGQPRYAKASWSLMVTDLDSGKTVYAAKPDKLAFTGSTRK